MATSSKRPAKRGSAPRDTLPPHDENFEKAALGALILDPKPNLGLFVERLGTPKAFYLSAHQGIVSALIELWDEGAAIDQVTLGKRLKERGVLAEVGGLPYIAELANSCPQAVDFEYYANELKTYHHARQLIFTCAEAIQTLRDEGKAADTLKMALDGVEQRINQARLIGGEAGERPVASIVEDAMELVEKYHRGGAQVEGILSGWHYFNKVVCGLNRGEMMILAARPSIGKTSFALQWAEYASIERKHKVALFSLEMSCRELGTRMIYGRADRNFQKFRTGMMLAEDVEHLGKAAAEFSEAPLWVDDSMTVAVNDVKARVRRLVAKHGIEFVVVDYLQLLTGQLNKRYGNRAEEVADISRNLKMLAKECNVALLVLSQMNRESERSGGIPKLSDLRESGAIEQDADSVCILYRPKLKAAEMEQFYQDMGWDPAEVGKDWSDKKFRTNILVAKNRNGPTGFSEFVFYGKSMRFLAYRRKHGVEETKLYPLPGEGPVKLFEHEELAEEEVESEL